MSGRGRARRGTSGQRRVRGLLPGPGHIEPSADLGPEALEHWHDLAPDLARLGLLHGEGAGLLSEYCRLTVQWHDIHASMRREREGFESPRRMRWLTELLRREDRLLRLEDRLGRSPLPRVRMGLHWRRHAGRGCPPARCASSSKAGRPHARRGALPARPRACPLRRPSLPELQGGKPICLGRGGLVPAWGGAAGRSRADPSLRCPVESIPGRPVGSGEWSGRQPQWPGHRRL